MFFHQGFETALREMRQGRKTSHWIWYIFPQLVELGYSGTARKYGVKGLAEAHAYLRHPSLRRNLITISDVVRHQLSSGVQLSYLMGGSIDTMKIMSSMTLFEAASRLLLEELRKKGEEVQASSEEKKEDEGKEEDDENKEISDAHKIILRVLELAEEQGYHPCQRTLEILSLA